MEAVSARRSTDEYTATSAKHTRRSMPKANPSWLMTYGRVSCPAPKTAMTTFERAAGRDEVGATDRPDSSSSPSTEGERSGSVSGATSSPSSGEGAVSEVDIRRVARGVECAAPRKTRGEGFGGPRTILHRDEAEFAPSSATHLSPFSRTLISSWMRIFIGAVSAALSQKHVIDDERSPRESAPTHPRARPPNDPSERSNPLTVLLARHPTRRRHADRRRARRARSCGRRPPLPALHRSPRPRRR